MHGCEPVRLDIAYPGNRYSWQHPAGTYSRIAIPVLEQVLLFHGFVVLQFCCITGTGTRVLLEFRYRYRHQVTRYTYVYTRVLRVRCVPVAIVLIQRNIAQYDAIMAYRYRYLVLAYCNNYKNIAIAIRPKRRAGGFLRRRQFSELFAPVLQY